MIKDERIGDDGIRRSIERVDYYSEAMVLAMDRFFKDKAKALTFVDGFLSGIDYKIKNTGRTKGSTVYGVTFRDEHGVVYKCVFDEPVQSISLKNFKSRMSYLVGVNVIVHTTPSRKKRR